MKYPIPFFALTSLTPTVMLKAPVSKYRKALPGYLAFYFVWQKKKKKRERKITQKEKIFAYIEWKEDFNQKLNESKKNDVDGSKIIVNFEKKEI